MKKHQDLLAFLRSQKMRVTPPRRLLLQFILDHSNRRLSIREIQEFMGAQLRKADRSSVYRNLETFERLGIIQSLSFPGEGRRYQYVFDRKVRHFYICRSCGKANRGDERLFRRVEAALKDIHGFAKANLSVVFYGACSKCRKNSPTA
ncbi:MAG: transcriptional repressor [Oligoflexia bacterium]|nr:transcriptional repressor [Oligoflexia bacterium]